MSKLRCLAGAGLIVGALAFVGAPAHSVTVTSFYDFTEGWDPYPTIIDGGGPISGLYLDSDGNYYGVTASGGISDQFGTIYKIPSTGTYEGIETPIYDFPAGTGGYGSNAGENPACTLIPGNTSGYLYGVSGQYLTTHNTGGAVFKVNTSTSAVTIMHTFTYGGTTDGYNTVGGLVLASNGYYYGVTAQGGAHSDGTIYSINESGTESVVYSFNQAGGPQAGLTLGSDGNIYGTTAGGTGGYGEVFKFVISTNTLTVLHNFNNTDGDFPDARLFQDSDGNLWGTTFEGGADSIGTVFKITTSGTFTSVHSFTGGSDGNSPMGGILQVGTGGNYYGTTFYGGANSGGTLFEISYSTGAHSVLYSFTNASSYTAGSEVGPAGDLIVGADSDLYGAADGGGLHNYGDIYKVAL